MEMQYSSEKERSELITSKKVGDFNLQSHLDSNMFLRAAKRSGLRLPVNHPLSKIKKLTANAQK